MHWEDLLEKAVYGGAGALASLGVAYVAIVRELSYIKGAMASWTMAIEKIGHIDERVQKLEIGQEKHAAELEALKPVPCDMAN